MNMMLITEVCVMQQSIDRIKTEKSSFLKLNPPVMKQEI